MIDHLLRMGQVKRWYVCHGSTGKQIPTADGFRYEIGPSLGLEIKPWWAAFLEFLVDRACGWFFLHSISLPKWPRWYDKEFECMTSLGDGWGDIGCVWDCYIFQFVYKLTWRYSKHVGIPISEEIQKQFPLSDRIWWMQQDQRHEEYLAEEAREEANGKATDQTVSDLPRANDIGPTAGLG